MNDLIPRSFLKFPVVSLPSLLDEVEDLLPTNNFLNGLSVSEDEQNIYIEAAVPGVDAKDVDVTFNKGIVTIRAEKKEEEKSKKFRRKATSSFYYQVAPGDVDMEKEPKAVYQNGVMKVTFPKPQESKPKKIAVKTA